MSDFKPLGPTFRRCHGFTCPHDREMCRRFTERNLAQPESPWIKGEFVDVLYGRGNVVRECVVMIAVKPVSQGAGVVA